MTADNSLDWINKHLVSILLSLALVRGGFLLVNGLDLLGDESYYWDWSRQPDWCYYSKPPMVAWLIGAFTWLLGDYTAIVRLPTIILGTLFLAYFHATAKAFYGPRAAALALLIVLATPINVVANFLMTIDPPLYCFWMMTLFYLRRALFDQQASAWYWAGLASAAALLSKQAALVLPVMLLLFLMLNRDYRHYLKRQFWLYLLPMLLVSAIILDWNHQHGWVMFGHSSSHFGNEEAVTLVKRVQHAQDFVLYQLLLLSPIILGLVLISSVKNLINWQGLTAEQRFLWLMGPVLLLAVLILSLLQKVQGNWPMAFYFSGIILLAGEVINGAWQRSIKHGLRLGFVLVGLTYVLPLLMQMPALHDSRWNPIKRFNEWQALAEAIHQQRLAAQPALQNSFVVALGHRYLASELAFYLPDHPQVFRFEESGQVTSQYEVWSGPQARLGQNAWVVTDGGEQSIPASLKAAFAGWRLVGEVAHPSKANLHYFIYLAAGLQQWPLADSFPSSKD